MEHRHYVTLYTYERHHWWYRVRRKLVHDLILRYRPTQHPLTIVDIGCGTGALAKELEAYGAYEGIDLSQEAVDFCRSRGVKNVHIGSAENTGCATGEKDFVLCLDVLEHLENDTKGMEEIYRVLKPGGVGIIFVPTFMSLWSITDEVSHHFRRYRLATLKKRVEGVGLVTIKASYFNAILFLPILFVRLLVRFFHIPITSEAETGSGVVNHVLYLLFDLERHLLSKISFPFGVSGMLIVKKPLDQE